MFCLVLVLIGADKKPGMSKAPVKKGAMLAKKRILSELRELTGLGLLLDEPFNTTMDECGIRLGPMKDNFFCWHFSITGVEGSHFEGGLYHGRILLHPEYPRKAPTICMLTPNGRWEIGKEICLSASAHHPETWDPKWNLRTLVLSLRSFMLTHPREIGGIHTRPETQAKLAAASNSYICNMCGIRHAGLVPGAKLQEDNSHHEHLRVLTGRNRSPVKRTLTVRKQRETKVVKGDLPLSETQERPLAPITTTTTVDTQSTETILDRENEFAEAIAERVSKRTRLVSMVRVGLTLAMLFMSFFGKSGVSFSMSL
jgi:ubiquitin-protein ligase